MVNEGLDLGLGYEHFLAGDLGQVSLDYRRSRFGFTAETYQSYQLGFSLYPDPRWRIQGSYALFDTGLESRTSASFELNYLLNEHQEVGLTFEQRPFLLYPDLPGLNLGQSTVGLQLRQSFDGPLQQRFAPRLEPELRVQVMARNPDDPNQLLPVVGAKLRVDDEVVAITGPDGGAKARVPQGEHDVLIDLDQVGPHFELVEGPEERIKLGAASSESLHITAVGYSGLRVVTWNDFFAESVMPAGYIPVSSVPLLVDGKQMIADQHGQLLVGRLAPGLHTVSISVDRLPVGMEAVGKAEQEIEIAPGQEAVFSVALRGFAEVSGTVRLLGGLAIPAQGLSVTANGREIGRTDALGAFLVKAPCQHSVRPGRGGSSAGRGQDRALRRHTEQALSRGQARAKARRSQ